MHEVMLIFIREGEESLPVYTDIMVSNMLVLTILISFTSFCPEPIGPAYSLSRDQD